MSVNNRNGVDWTEDRFGEVVDETTVGCVGPLTEDDREFGMPFRHDRKNGPGPPHPAPDSPPRDLDPSGRSGRLRRAGRKSREPGLTARVVVLHSGSRLT